QRTESGQRDWKLIAAASIGIERESARELFFHLIHGVARVRWPVSHRPPHRMCRVIEQKRQGTSALHDAQYLDLIIRQGCPAGAEPVSVAESEMKIHRIFFADRFLNSAKYLLRQPLAVIEITRDDLHRNLVIM